MKLEIGTQNKATPKVPFVPGGVYRCESNGYYYILNERRQGGYQLNTPTGEVLCEGPMGDEAGVTRFLNDHHQRWNYIPNAKLVIEE